MSVDKNMELWNSVGKTDPRNTKEVNFGRKFTAIDAHSQVMELTKQFGPCGIGWGVSDSQFKLLIHNPNDQNQNSLEYTGKLWFVLDGKRGEFDIAADIDCYEYVVKKQIWKKVDDTHKKVKTAALSKGVSLLGFNADVFMGLYDDNAYVRSLRNEFNESGQPSGNPDPPPTKSSYVPKASTPVPPQVGNKNYQPATKQQKDSIEALCRQKGITSEQLKARLSEMGTSWKNMSFAQADNMLVSLSPGRAYAAK